MIAPYTVPVFERVAERAGVDLFVAYETAMEANREWSPPSVSFDHRIVSSWSVDLRRAGIEGFVHVPREGLGALWTFRPDVVLASGAGVWSSPADVLALARAARGEFAFVPWWGSFAREDPGLLRSAAEIWMRAFVARGDAWLAYGSRAASHLVHLGADPRRIVISPNVARPPEIEGRPQGDRNGGATRFLFVGQLIERKGIELLLDAFDGLSGGELWVAGDGPLRRLVQAAARRDPRIHFLGDLGWVDLHRRYGLADVLVVPSSYEVWGLVVNEAVEHGLPVIATDQVAAADDLVEDGVTGRVVPALNRDALLAAMREISAWTPQQRERCATLSRQIADDWSVERAADGIVAAAGIAVEARRGTSAGRRVSPAPIRPAKRKLKIVVVKNMIAPYTTPVFARLAENPDVELLVIYETSMERNRQWIPEKLPYRHSVLRTVSVPLAKLGAEGFVHVPAQRLREVVSFRPDAVIVGGAGIWSSPLNLALLAGRRRHGWGYTPWWESFARAKPTIGRRIATPWVKHFVRTSDSWVASGSRAADHLASLGADRRRIVISPNVAKPVERSAAARASSPASGDRVLFVGQLIERKCVRLLLNAFSDIAGGELWIAGDGPLRELVLDAARRDDRIHFLGHLDWSELHDRYADADMLVLPSSYEVWGMVVNEALEHGIPVITTTQVAAADDLLEDGVTARIVPPDNRAALAEALRDVASWTPEQRIRCAARARETIDDWSIQRAADGIVEAARLAIQARQRS